jgi:hypothetical protein
MDLGFPRFSTHYRGSFFEQRSHQLSERTFPAEMMGFTYLYNGYPFYTENNRGGETLTDKRLVMYKWWFENQAKIYPATSTFTLAEEGVKIEGLSYQDPEQLLTYPPIRGKIEDALAEVLEKEGKTDLRRKYQKLHQAVEELLAELEALDTAVRQGLEIAETMESELDQGSSIDSYLRSLEEVDKRILSSTTKDIAGFLLSAMIDTIVESGKQKLPPHRIVENSKGIYRELHRSISYHEDQLQRILTSPPCP